MYNVATVLGADRRYQHGVLFHRLERADAGINQEAWRKFNTAQVGIDLDANYSNLRTRENHYCQDRQAMKLGDFTGIKGIPNQDIAMWESMGPIADRTRERLGASERRGGRVPPV